MTKKRETDPAEEAPKRQWTPPRGIRLLEIPERPSPYAVQWRIDGKVKTKTFETKAAQVEFAKSLAGDLKEGGIAALRLDTNEARVWRAFRAEIGHDDASPHRAFLAYFYAA